MPRDLTYDQTVLMLAVLAASADGARSHQEAAVITQRLGPIVHRMGPAGQEATLTLLDDLLQTIGMERTLMTLRAHLPYEHDRAEAVRLACKVAFADGRISAKEGHHIAWLADLLGLSEDDLAKALAA